MLVLLLSVGSTLVLKVVKTVWKRRILVDFGDKKDGKRPEYKGKDIFMRRVRVTD